MYKGKPGSVVASLRCFCFREVARGITFFPDLDDTVIYCITIFNTHFPIRNAVVHELT